MTAWTDTVSKTFKNGRLSNPAYQFKDALQDAKKFYKKGEVAVVGVAKKTRKVVGKVAKKTGKAVRKTGKVVGKVAKKTGKAVRKTGKAIKSGLKKRSSKYSGKTRKNNKSRKYKKMKGGDPMLPGYNSSDGGSNFNQMNPTTSHSGADPRLPPGADPGLLRNT